LPKTKNQNIQATHFSAPNSSTYASAYPQDNTLQDGSIRRSPYTYSDCHKWRKGALTVAAARMETLVCCCKRLPLCEGKI
jgi:hypothetical protein